MGRRTGCGWLPVVLFVKGDGVEHDKLCGHYVPKNRGIENICRYCCIASNECDQPYLDPPPHMKTMAMIADLVKQGDNYTLQKLSQHAIWNCFYELRFGLHNGANIHGACPMETLHWILLGMYKYSRENFFAQTGVESILSENLNDVAVSIGILLKRQSDRDMPRTKYRNGIKSWSDYGSGNDRTNLGVVDSFAKQQGQEFDHENQTRKAEDLLPQ